jgi:hypothetical protein
MSLDAIRDQIAAILASVQGVGVVHQYVRHAKDRDKFMSLFRHETADGKKEINGWMIAQAKRSVEESEFDEGVRRTRRWMLRGVFGLRDDDATAIEFENTVERICEKFEEKADLNGTVTDSNYAQAEVIEPRMFFGVLCHYAEISLETIEVVDD